MSNWTIQQPGYGDIQPLSGNQSHFDTEGEANAHKDAVVGRLRMYLNLLRQGSKVGNKTEADLIREIGEVEQWVVVRV